MVTFKGLNQFWKRHGRQKDKMTTDEIGDAFERRTAGLNRLERFLFLRRAQLLERAGSSTQLVVATCPVSLGDSLLDTSDASLRQLMLNPPFSIPRFRINCGQAYPTLEGLRADQHTPYYADNQPIARECLEVFSTGYLEYRRTLDAEGKLGLVLRSLYDLVPVINFITFAQAVYAKYTDPIRMALMLSVLNAKGLWLARGSSVGVDPKVKWPEQHLELGSVYTDNMAGDRDLLTKQLLDRLWRAFHLEKCELLGCSSTSTNTGG